MAKFGKLSLDEYARQINLVDVSLIEDEASDWPVFSVIALTERGYHVEGEGIEKTILTPSGQKCGTLTARALTQRAALPFEQAKVSPRSTVVYVVKVLSTPETDRDVLAMFPQYKKRNHNPNP